MAEELRWTHLIDTSSGTSTETNNAVASFQNTTDEDIHIRNIDYTGVIVDTSPVTNASGYAYVTAQISKQIAYEAVSGSTNWKQNVVTSIDTTTNGTNVEAGKTSTVQNKSFRFAKGQLVLEPNETLYIHDVLTMSQLQINAHSSAWLIGYHF